MGKEERKQEGETGLATRRYQDPFSLLDSMFERMHRDFFGASLLNALVPGRSGDREEGGVVRVPRVQMRDTGDAIEVTAELPGIDGKDVRVECEDDILTISGEAHAEETREGERMERHTRFHRQIALPDGVDVDSGQASYRNGVLSIRFPRRAQRQNTRQIPISTESGDQPQRKDRAA